MAESNQRQRDQNVVAILTAAVKETVSKTSSFHYDTVRRMEAALNKVVVANCNKILNAAEISPSKIRQLSDWEKKRKEERISLAKELRAGRTTLKELTQKISYSEKQLVVLSRSAGTQYGYPEVPDGTVPLSKKGDNLPACSGVYFAWVSGKVQYVGQSINLQQRCRVGHHALQEGDLISWVEVETHSLNFAEAFYIGMLMPPRNFRSLSCYVVADGEVKNVNLSTAKHW